MVAMKNGCKPMNLNEYKIFVETSREAAMAIIDQLPQSEFSKVVEDIRTRSRERALGSFRKMRAAVRKSGLRKKDFDEALKETRAEKAKKTTDRRS
jgi:hypothetical protein